MASIPPARTPATAQSALVSPPVLIVMDPLVDALLAWEVVAPPTGPVSVVDCAATEVAEAYLMIVSLRLFRSSN